MRRPTLARQWRVRLLGGAVVGVVGYVAAVLLDGTNRFQTGQFFDFSGGWGA